MLTESPRFAYVLFMERIEYAMLVRIETDEGTIFATPSTRRQSPSTSFQRFGNSGAVPLKDSRITILLRATAEPVVNVDSNSAATTHAVNERMVLDMALPHDDVGTTTIPG